MADATFRLARPKGYTAISRDAMQDERLSLKARGLYGMMITLPDNWEYTIAGLAKKSGCGKDQIRSGLAELLQVGYLVKEQSHGERGKFGKNVFVLLETAPPLSGFPTTGNPTTENPLTGFPTEKNKDKKKKEIKPPISPEGKARFEMFWAAYPRHEAKSVALKSWSRLEATVMTAALFDRILAAVEARKETDQWQRDGGRYIPQASVWLNQERWEDELPGAGASSTRVVEEEGVRSV